MSPIRPLLALALSGLAASAPADATPDPHDVMRAVRHSRERLMTGSFVAAGQYVLTTKGGPASSRNGPVEVRMVFDLPAELVRFEMDRPPIINLPEPGQYPGLKLPADPVMRTKLLLTPEKTYQWSEDLGDAEASRLPVSVRPPDIAHPAAPPWDVGLIGLYSGVEMLSFSPPDFTEFLDIAYSPDDATDVRWVRPGVLQIEFTGRKAETGLYGRLLIDTERGYTPLRQEVWEEGFENPDRLELWTETSWRAQNGAWVPAALQSQRGRPNENRLYESIRLAFDWAGVNEPVDPALFEPSDLPLDPETHIVDRRLDVPVTVGSVGAPDALPVDAELYPAGPPPEGFWSRGVTAAVVLLGVGAGAAVLWYRRRATS